ncbi:hypothetical protein WG68_17075 [Arsukibacterium ikkense]|uniref:Uncharacterized protein n=1 Tax=Arsukibacterium ikkense TaxID=336831 RepID=A0A0M2V1C5_9GAMM|nr:hypothetical protein [Arsukibacterium ikkense]KKO44169.1 hypothetical protein WG68_17075 [Arsukibacterium ikkense]
MADLKPVVPLKPQRIPRMPKRWFNRVLVYVGVFGIVFQLTAALYALWQGVYLQQFWFITLLAPLLCVFSGMVPALQLQREPDA